jgi:hypothetical protein
MLRERITTAHGRSSMFMPPCGYGVLFRGSCSLAFYLPCRETPTTVGDADICMTASIIPISCVSHSDHKNE